LSRLPLWLSRWLGYRASAPKPEPQLVVYFWSFIASFCTISILQAIFSYASYFRARHVPAVIGSYGASAVLCFDVIGVPFAQPRALVGGHFISALVGICVTRLIEVRHDGQLLWLAGSLSTALAIVAMRFTKTTHPPAGATALLAAVDPNIHALGWYYLPVILLSSIVMLVMALFFNNIQRRYPSFWISPPTLPTPTPAPE
ncbi:HPP family protein, partial [Mollisia scopiformis]